MDSDGDEEEDIETLAQAEITKLQRQYRLLEGKRKTYCEQSQITIKKQKILLSQLEADKEELKHNLKVAQCKKNVIKDSEYMEELSRLLHEQDFFKDLIKEEKEAIKKLEEEAERVKNETIEQNRKIQGKTGPEQAKKMQKQIRTMENRLEITTVEYNRMLTNNNKLRGQISHLRTQRSVFDTLYKKLTKKLNHQKKRMQTMMDQSTQAYDQRDDAQIKIMTLKASNERDLQKYNYEYRELMRIIDHDAKLKSFMNTKAQERCDTKNQAEKDDGESDKAERTAKEMISTYERSFKTIREITGEPDMYALVKRYVETEEKNYALFTYINELNSELNSMEIEIEGVRQEIRDYNESGVGQQTDRLKLLKDLEKKLEDAQLDEEHYSTKLSETETVLTTLKEGIATVFKEINCDHSILSQALGDSSSVNDENIFQYLSLIEARTNQLVQVHSYLQLKELERDEPMKTPVSILGGPGGPPKKLSIHIQTPVINEKPQVEEPDAVETEDIAGPITPAELMKQALKNAIKLEQEVE